MELNHPVSTALQASPNASRIAHTSINYRQHERADTNKGDLAQRDAEGWLSLAWSGDASPDLTERNSCPLAEWQHMY